MVPVGKMLDCRVGIERFEPVGVLAIGDAVEFIAMWDKGERPFVIHRRIATTIARDCLLAAPRLIPSRGWRARAVAFPVAGQRPALVSARVQTASNDDFGGSTEEPT